MPLSLPQARVKNGAGQTIKDLSDHPWAGAEVSMTLVARDEANNEGTSAAHEFRLPEHPFTKPLARVIIEQRRELALDGESRDKVLIALDALAIAPDKFTPELGTYLGLPSLFWALSQARDQTDCATSCSRYGSSPRCWRRATSPTRRQAAQCRRCAAPGARAQRIR